MLCIRLIVLISALVVAAPQPSSGASTYYLATDGSDSNNGLTTAAPYATFGKAIGAAHAGDTVFVRGGTYNLSATISISSSKVGTAANPFNLFAYTGESPVLNFSGEAA